MKTMNVKRIFNVMKLVAIFVMAIVMTSCAEEILKIQSASVEGVSYEIDFPMSKAKAKGYYVVNGEFSPILEILNEITCANVTFQVIGVKQRAFINGCWSIVRIGENITTIGDEAFIGCNDISTIIITGEVAPLIDGNTFEDAVYENAKLVLNNGAVIDGTPWDRFKNVVRR